MNTSKLAGHSSAFGAYLIFGVNLILCKDISTSGTISPEVLFTLRAAGASLLFWVISLFLPKEKVSLKDLGLIVAASLLGLFIPQFTFLESITMTTPLDSGLLATLPPIFTMLFAALFLKEPITWKKALGVALSFGGVIFLIFNSVHHTSGSAITQTHPLGIILMLINGLSFAAYLGAFRPLIARYSVVTFMKWMFLVSLLVSLPFSLKGTISLDYSTISSGVAWEVAFVIFFATFVAYFLIPLAQKHIRPTLVSMYSYIQPLVAAVISVIIGMDRLGWQKVVATLLIFSGVWIVSRSRKADPGKDTMADMATTSKDNKIETK